MRRRRLLAVVGTVASPLLAGCSSDGGDGSDGGPSPTDSPTDADGTPSPAATDTADGATVSIGSPAFDDGGALPVEHTCSGEGSSPPLQVEVVGDAPTVALIVDDPDAPRAEPFVHWLAWDVPASLETWPTDIGTGGRPPELDGGAQGQHSAGDLGYFPACPPKGDGSHRYRFTAVAVDTTLGLAAGADRAALESALEGHVLARDRLVGTFERE